MYYGVTLSALTLESSDSCSDMVLMLATDGRRIPIDRTRTFVLSKGEAQIGSTLNLRNGRCYSVSVFCDSLRLESIIKQSSGPIWVSGSEAFCENHVQI